MRLTTKGRFAVTAMIDLGLRHASGPVTLAAISQRQQISLSYLEQLFGKLRRNELVESTRGPGGGYKLVASLNDLSVWDVVNGLGFASAGNDKAQSSPEWQLTNQVSEQAFLFEKAFLQDYLLIDLLSTLPESASSKPSKSMAMNFKPLPSALIPIAPNSVFNLSNFLNLQAA